MEKKEEFIMHSLSDFLKKHSEEASIRYVPFVHICDRLWENPAKVARQNSEKKGEK
jgi:hypothetical protein